ncbi:MAG: glycosyltransferase family 2 protein [Syntrophales bacterium]
MNGMITAVFPFSREDHYEEMSRVFNRSPLVKKIIGVYGRPSGTAGKQRGKLSRKSVICNGVLTSGQTLSAVLEDIRSKYILLITGNDPIWCGPGMVERFVDVAETTRAGMVYSDFFERQGANRWEHPLIDYQLGSIRDNFDFGPMVLISMDAARQVLKKYRPIPDVSYAALYDLRLKISADFSIFRIQEFLYTRIARSLSADSIFDYVDPLNRTVQIEMETVATDHLRRTGAYLEPVFKKVPPARKRFPVEASVIIPVRNRASTIAEAVHSALAQKTDFPFNVIVVDNHSDDGTTRILSSLAKKHHEIKHLIASRDDLGIGGCWNEALLYNECGRYAVQLDSDDLYGADDVLQRIVGEFRRGNYAMVIGSYTLVDAALREIPPGLIDHREWTDENGRNNALRVNGLGAPRAFNTALMRRIGFLNVSYGEDYAAALRLSREYRIGRIYDSLYLCRRWEGNTDSSLPADIRNRNDFFKDRIRSIEILARRKMNGLP